MIFSIKTNLQRTISLLKALDDSDYTDSKVGPYYSSIGSHVRHILDFYDCVLRGLPYKKVDLTSRKRNEEVETSCDAALTYVNAIMSSLSDLKFNQDDAIMVIDNLGHGNVEIPYTTGALLAQANTHAIHHYAIVAQLAYVNGIAIEDEAFGYNPSTPRENQLTNR